MRLNYRMRLLLPLALALADPGARAVEAEDSGTCLLSLRTKTSRASEEAPAETFSAQWASLLLRHRAEVFAAEPTGGAPEPLDIDAFIKEQLASADHCHSRLLEARRTLDGIEGQVQALADSIQSHHDVELSNTRLLKDAIAEKEAATAAWEAARADCDDAGLDPAVAQYKRELEELTNIANPKVRSEIAHGEEATDYAAEARAYADAVRAKAESSQEVQDAIAEDLEKTHNISLLQWGTTQCHQFASFLEERAGADAPKYTELGCNDTRDNLQNEFSTSYLMISNLYNEGLEQAEEERLACRREADEAYQSRCADVDAKIRDATESIFKARAVLDDLTPLHQTLTRTAAALEAHLEDLRESCSEAGEVSEHLERIRRLIRTLAACPGRNDFVLEIPNTMLAAPDPVSSCVVNSNPRGRVAYQLSVVRDCWARDFKPSEVCLNGRTFTVTTSWPTSAGFSVNLEKPGVPSNTFYEKGDHLSPGSC